MLGLHKIIIFSAKWLYLDKKSTTDFEEVAKITTTSSNLQYIIQQHLYQKDFRQSLTMPILTAIFKKIEGARMYLLQK